MAFSVNVGDGNIYLGRAFEQVTGLFAVEDKQILRVVWPYQKIPHALIVGATGGGKTSLLRVMIWNLTSREHAPILCLADGIPDADSFKMFTGQPGVAAISVGTDTTTELAADVFTQYRRRLTDLGKARQEALNTRSRPSYREPKPLFFLIDEYLVWVLNLDGDKPKSGGLSEREEVINQLREIGLNGRKVNIYLLLAMQRAGIGDANAGLPGALKSQLKCRIAATGEAGMDSTEAQIAFDDTGVAKRVPMLEGAGYVKAGGAEVSFKVPWLPDPTDPKITERMTDQEIRETWALLPRGATEAAQAARELVGGRT